MKPFKRLLLMLVLLLLALPVYGIWWLNEGFERGAKLLRNNRYQHARREIERYLWFRDDEEALLALAEAYVRDSEIPAEQSAEKAIAVLSRVDEDSELAGKARLQEARLRFLILNQPCRAEKLLDEVFRDSPSSFAANYLKWKILDLTRRYHLVEPYFRTCFESAETSRREELLYEWYYSQFSTYSATSHLDQMMGVVAAGKPSDTIVEHRRLDRFLTGEPDCALNYAIMADWYHEHGMDHETWNHFDDAWAKADKSTPVYAYAIFFDLLLNAGRFEEVKTVIEAWPEPRSGYDYFKREGLYFAEIRDRPDLAIESFRKALPLWPGPVDWQLHHRLAGILTRVGQLEEAEMIRKEGKRLEQLMEVDYHKSLRKILADRESNHKYQQIAEFYQQIDRNLESEAWQSLANTQTVLD